MDAYLGNASRPVGFRQSYVRIQCAGLFIRLIDGLDLLRERRTCVLVEEARFGRALRTVDQRNRQGNNFRQDGRRDGPVVAGQFLLGQLPHRIDNLVGVGEVDVNNRSTLCRT